MKLTNREFAGRAAALARSASVVFLCGPDEAGALAAAHALIAHLPDPGERVDLAGADLRGDPGRLGDEARSQSLFGGARHILVRVSGDEAHDAVQTLLETGAAGAGAACPVIVHATGATDKSRTARLLEGRGDAAVVVFWPPDLRSVTETVRRLGDAAGVRLSAQLAERIAAAAGLDIGIAAAEVEKLALLLDAAPTSPRTATAEALDSIAAVTADDSVQPVVDAVLGGKVGRLADELGRLASQQLGAVTVLLALERRVAQLERIARETAAGRPLAQALEAEQKARRLFWRDRGAVEAQARRWPPAEIARLVERVALLHRAMLTDSRAASVLLRQELAMIARAAARRDATRVSARER
ncbi:DNA polymerase III subunit delta [Erythrobacteraceae bacterium CFH 75059]|uniref:DNA polymerase III subunit delta n=1 Tax=Qipengyuania thermophila TaxID=2509361 RepID=UPI00102026D7|nr:DNA polymerase III subunit delta [Qipengyuania thermophila]TCD06542.1 DNA polymerase III subunit delta [Erythrobacteraceae bacterium CFH 75059]